MLEIEKKALAGAPQAILQIVSALREYRVAIQTLLTSRYNDGAVDGATMSTFANKISEIEIMESDTQ